MGFTIRDVAKESNVSVATVSRVINGLKGYSKDTEEKVLRVIEDMGYKPNAIARSLAVKSTQIIGVILPDPATNAFTEVLNGIEEAAHRNGYSVIICNTGISGVRALEY